MGEIILFSANKIATVLPLLSYISDLCSYSLYGILPYYAIIMALVIFLYSFIYFLGLL